MKRTALRHFAALLLGAALLWGAAMPASAAWTDRALESAEAYNLIQNSGFEDGLNEWQPGITCALSDDAYSGNHSLLIGVTDSLEQTFTVPEAGEYVFQLSLKTDSPTMVVCQLEYDGSAPTIILNVPHTQWGRYGMTLTLPKEAAGEPLSLAMVPLDDVLVDDIRLIPTRRLSSPVPTDPAQNLVADGSFESGIAGWTSGCKLSNPTVSHTGARSLLADNTGGAKAATASLPLPSLPAGEYEVTCWLRRSRAGVSPTTNVSVERDVEEGGAFIYSVDTYDEWMKVTVLASFPEAVENDLSLKLSIPGGEALYVDDVSIYPTGYPDFPAPKQNLLQNPGFESGLGGWAQRGSPTAFATDGQAYTGTQSAYFGYFASAPMENYLEQTVAAGAGSYTFSAMVKPDATLQGVGCMLMLEALDSSGAVLATVSSPAVSDPSKGWQNVRATLTAPAGTASLRLKIGGIYCTGAFFVDDVSLLKA